MQDSSGDATRALVLGGGGLAGIAWEIGLLARWAELGIDLVAGADLLVGTSAGATVGALVAGGSDYATLIAAQRRPAEQTKERVPDFNLDLLVEVFTAMTRIDGDPGANRRHIGALALGADTVSEPERREIIAARLADDAWPERVLVITAVEAHSGERVAFDASSPVSLVDAVAASSAVPGIWPPVTIAGRRYIDGGVYSVTNADLAAHCDRVVVLCPVTMGPGAPHTGGRTVADAADGALAVVPDARSLAAFGPNLLDPASRPAAVEQGLRQAEETAEAVGCYLAGEHPPHADHGAAR